MIILDTNVVSALLRPQEEPRVMAWLDGQLGAELHTSSITIFELAFGVERLPESRRRAKLAADLDLVIERLLGRRILPLDTEAARAAGAIRAERNRIGKPVDVEDTLIAGLAVSRNAAIATRNVRHFEDLAVEVIDPWAG